MTKEERNELAEIERKLAQADAKLAKSATRADALAVIDEDFGGEAEFDKLIARQDELIAKRCDHDGWPTGKKSLGESLGYESWEA